MRTRDLSGFDRAYLFLDTVYEPLRRWGSKTGILCVWGICADGRKVLRTLSTAHRESDESCLAVLRDLMQRGLQTPVTITTDGAPGLRKAIDAMGPRSLRMRCWFHKMQHLHAAGKVKKVPLTACMHKFLTILNAMLKHRTPWQSQEVQG